MVFLILRWYVRWRRPHLSDAVEEHRVTILAVLGLVLLGIKVSEDALSGDSGPMDKQILLVLHQHVPAGLTRFFDFVTLTGSFNFFVPLVMAATILFVVFRKRFEAVLLAGSAISGGLVIYLVKQLTDRERPALWETRWYWGTSFPSGHTLETACVGMALAICLGRICPGGRLYFRVGALVWIGLVGLSRLILGVHWPTDVAVAGCLGILVPVAIRMGLLLASHRWAATWLGGDSS